MDSSDWSNGIRYHVFDARADTELNLSSYCWIRWGDFSEKKMAQGELKSGGVDNLGDGPAAVIDCEQHGHV